MLAPLWVALPFHSCVTVCPLAKVHVSVQFDMAVVPVTVIVKVPAAAVLLAIRVRMLAPVVGLVANAAVTPGGSPDTASVTLPLNPPASVTVMVSVALPLGVKARVEADGARVKPGVADPPNGN